MLTLNTGTAPKVNAVAGANDRYAKFTVSPLPKGYGHTLGASLRRVLLSSIQGISITAIQVQGVQHEFSTMPGIVEDMMEIVLNIKEIAIKTQGGPLEGPVAARIDKVGEGRVTAADIQLPPGITIVSPEKPICTLSKPEARFDAVLTIEAGTGYVTASQQERAKTIGTIPVDANYSPVTRVNYYVEPTRVGQQTELDKLVLEIFTTGALPPQACLAQAAAIMQQYLALFSGLEGGVEIAPLAGETQAQSRARDIKIDDLDFSNRTYNCLKRQGIETLEELAGYTEEELMNIRNFGQKSLDEVKDKLIEYNMGLRPMANADAEEYAI